MRLIDGLVNFLVGLGVRGRDRVQSGSFELTLLSDQELTAAYRSNWIARKIVDIPPDDMTREWRDWQADNKEIEILESAERVFGVRQKVREAMVLARLYGGAAIVLGVDDVTSSQMAMAPLNVERVGRDSLKFLHVVPRQHLSFGELENDISSPWFGEPKFYTRTNITSSAIDPSMQIHPSRVIKFVGAPIPDRWQALTPWGDSYLQVVDDAVKAACTVNAGLAHVMTEIKYDVIKTPRLMETLGDAQATEVLIKRMNMNATMKGLCNTLLIDKEEDWNTRTLNIAGAPDIVKTFFLIVCGAADIPATRFFGQSPAGMSATGESDTRNYYDRVKSDQENDLAPMLSVLDEILIRSSMGARDPSIYFEWAPLWQMTEKEKSEISKAKADTAKLDVDTALVPFEVLAVARVNQLIEDGTYPGLESALKDYEEAGGVIGESDDDTEADGAGVDKPGDGTEGEGGSGEVA